MNADARAWPTFSGLWQAAVLSRPAQPFLVFEGADGQVATWTYEQFDDVVQRTAAGLVARGVGPGDRVHVVLPNSVALVAVWLACASLGAVFSSSDPRARAPELAHQQLRLAPVLTVCGVDQAAQLPGATRYGPVVVAGSPSDALTDLAEPAVRAGAPAPRAVDPLGVLFTSGTTSQPKGVVLSQGLYAHTGTVMANAAALTPDSRFLVALPLFHANAQYYCFAAAIAVGASVALVAAFSATRYLAQIDRLGATHGSLFAAPVRMVLARGGGRALRRPLQHMWFAQDLTQHEYNEASRLLGCRPRQLYGMTETGPAVLMQPADAAGPHSLGSVAPGCRARLGDPDGRAVPDGRVVPDGAALGEIQVGGHPGLSVFTGYLDDPAATAQVVVAREQDGSIWFRTGDRATVDDAGTWWFGGRGSDQMKVAGENVSAVEIEQVLARHPGVFEAAVTSRPDPVRTEVPVAHVVPAGTPAPDFVDSLRAWCEDQLAPTKRPQAIHIVDELPRTSVGKIRKFMLGTDQRPGPDQEENA